MYDVVKAPAGILEKAKKGESVYFPFESMAVGEMFVVTDKADFARAKVAASRYRAANNGVRFTCRIINRVLHVIRLE